MENVFQGTGEVIRDGKNYLLVLTKEMADKAGLTEGSLFSIEINESAEVKIDKLRKE